MKFSLPTQGKRFYFFTFSVRDRVPLLSRLVRGARPELTTAGEGVRRLWMSLHRLETHFTALDYIIMPEHAHFLLMVASLEAFAFSPLVFAHWFMTWSEQVAGGVEKVLTPEDWGRYCAPS